MLKDTTSIRKRTNNFSLLDSTFENFEHRPNKKLKTTNDDTLENDKDERALMFEISEEPECSVLDGEMCVNRAEVFSAEGPVGGSANTIGEMFQKVVLDSGASRHIVPHKEMFAFLSTSSVKVRVADRVLKQRGQLGLLKPNGLGQKYAVYHPQIECVLFSSSVLEDEGFIIHQERGNRFLKTPTGEVVVVERDSNTNLPFVMLSFEEGNGNPTSGKGAEHEKFCDEDVSFGHMCEVVSGMKAGMSEKELLRTHERMGHFHVPGISVKCPACDIAKAIRTSHKKERPEHLKPMKVGDATCVDFSMRTWGSRTTLFRGLARIVV